MRRFGLLCGCMAALGLFYTGTAAAQPAPPPIAAYGSLPGIETMVLSPAGQVAMIATIEGRRAVIALDANLKPLRTVEIGDVKVRDIEWIGDDALAIMRSDTQELGVQFYASQMEIGNVLIFPVRGDRAPRYVFDGVRGIAQAVFGSSGYRQVDGRWVGYFAGQTMDKDRQGYSHFSAGAPDLYAVDVASNGTRRVSLGSDSSENVDWLVAPDGGIAATLRWDRSSDNWRVVDGRGRQLAAGNAPDGSGAVQCLGADGSSIVYTIWAKDRSRTDFEVPLAGGEARELFAGKDVGRLLCNQATTRLMGHAALRTDEGAGGLQELDHPEFIDPGMQAVMKRVTSSFAAAGGRATSWTPDLKRMLVTTGGSSDSGTWYLVDTDLGTAEVIGIERPEIAPEQVAPVSHITYTAQDGTRIGAILTLPPGREAKDLPVVLLPHGGPRAHDMVTFDWWPQALASRGYVVLQPNFRGSTGYGDAFMHAGDGEWGGKMQTDLSDGLAHLAAQGMIDPARACIVGASYGGYAALAGVTLQQDLYRCAVSVAGVSDLPTFFGREYRESGRSRDLREGWLEMMGPRNRLAAISPSRAAGQGTAPVLLIHGRDDTVVPFEQSTIMADALRAAGRPVELVDLAGEDHWLSLSTTRQQMLEATVRFVEQHNPAE